MVGNLMSKYDAPRRTGFNFTVCGSSPGYSGMSDAKNIHFGIDSGVCGSWMDCGKPWKSNPLIGTLIAYKGDLYTGIADASRPEDACHVFRYAGETESIDCGRLGNDLLSPAVFSVVVHRGSLYAGTGQWDWFRARAGIAGINHVYNSYEGEKEWSDCGQLGNGYRVMSLASFRGNLYASDDQLKVYRYEVGKKWAYCGQLSAGDERLVNCITASRGIFMVPRIPAFTVTTVRERGIASVRVRSKSRRFISSMFTMAIFTPGPGHMEEFCDWTGGISGQIVVKSELPRINIRSTRSMI